MPEKDQLFVANVPLKIERKGQATLEVPAGEVVRDAPANWPPKWVVDAGWVSPAEDEALAPQQDDKPGRPALGAIEGSA